MNRDVHKFSELYESFNSRIYNFVFKLTGDRLAAEDITQETFIQVFNKIETFRAESSLLTWIYTIAKNNCFKFLNKKKRSSFKEIEDLIHTAGTANDSGDYDDFEKKIYTYQVKEGCLLGLLRCLSYYQRISFILHILYEVPIEQTAAIIDKSPNAARILIHRARSKLKSFLCKNCSLYDTKNECKCENLILFSLNQGWIGKKDNLVSSKTIESELGALGDEVLLFKTLEDRKSPEEIGEKVKNFIEQNDFHIFKKRHGEACLKTKM